MTINIYRIGVAVFYAFHFRLYIASQSFDWARKRPSCLLFSQAFPRGPIYDVFNQEPHFGPLSECT